MQVPAEQTKSDFRLVIDSCAAFAKIDVLMVNR